MEKEVKMQRGSKAREGDFVLQWGERKRLRCIKVNKEQKFSNNNNKISSKQHSTSAKPNPYPLTRTPDFKRNNRKPCLVSPEKEDRYYTTRGSLGWDESGKISMDTVMEKKGNVWPKLFTTLSSKEKEEDFMAMKGCKLPVRPKKRAKLIQKSLLLVSPGAWLSDLCQERYEVREKKTSKKRPTGLKAMGSMESDSE